MEQLSIAKIEAGIQIEDFPDAVKVIRLQGPKSQRLADLALHREDLDFALQCLKAINDQAGGPPVVRQALWQSAIIHFMKCFGKSESRFGLDANKVYKGDAGASEPFEFFESLRNKHIVHDENSFAQCLPGAVLNKQGMDHKIAKIVCFSAVGNTLEQDTYSNLHLLATRAREWVVEQFDELCELLTSELEAASYDALLALDSVTFTAPGTGDVHKSRRAL